MPVKYERYEVCFLVQCLLNQDTWSSSCLPVRQTAAGECKDWVVLYKAPLTCQGSKCDSFSFKFLCQDAEKL